MPEVTRRRTGEFVRKLFEILLDKPAGLPASEALKQLATHFALTPYEAGVYKSGARRLDKIVRFATVDCSKAGWLIKDKGRWLLSDEGRNAYVEFKDPEALYRRAVQLYRQMETEPAQ